jgi:hypothetical protein
VRAEDAIGSVLRLTERHASLKALLDRFDCTAVPNPFEDGLALVRVAEQRGRAWGPQSLLLNAALVPFPSLLRQLLSSAEDIRLSRSTLLDDRRPDVHWESRSVVGQAQGGCWHKRAP